MPSGAKKRKALKKKKLQEAIRTSTNNKGFNGGHNEHGSQEERESDSNLSSPGSQGNENLGTKDPSAAQPSGMVKTTGKEISGDANVTQGNETLKTKDPSAAQPSGMVKSAAKEISGDANVTQGIGPISGNAIVVETGTESPNSSSENCTHTTKNVTCQEDCGNSIMEIAPTIDSIKPLVSASKGVSSEESEHVDALTHSNLVTQKSDENEKHPYPGLVKDNSKVVALPRPAANTGKKVESIKESEVTVSSEEKRLLLPGPPVVRRTSWLSCCGLFEVMTGSDK